MAKLLTVAFTEYLMAVRSKAFVIGVLMLPVLMGASVLIQHFARGKVDIRDRRFAVIDQTGVLFPVLKAKAAERNDRDIFDGQPGASARQVRPAFFPERFAPPENERAQMELALSERVRKKEFFAFLVIGRDATSIAGGLETEIAYFTETPTYEELPSWVDNVLNEEIKRLRFEQAQLDQALVRKLTRSTPIKRLGLATRAETGEVIKAKVANRAATFAIPAVSMFLLFMLVMSSAPALLNTVLEEKMQRISEVLLSSVSPFQLMLGKLAGAVMVSLTLSLLYLGAIAFFLWRSGLGNLVPPTHYLWFLLFQLLGLMIFGSVCSAIGAACTEIKDAQNMMFPAMILIMLPLFVWMPVMQSPTSPFARLALLFPPATPMLMMLRIAIPPGPPWWEIALGVVLTTGFMLACVWASAKIFRVGILSQGQTPSFGQMLRWVFSR